MKPPISVAKALEKLRNECYETSDWFMKDIDLRRYEEHIYDILMKCVTTVSGRTPRNRHSDWLMGYKTAEQEIKDNIRKEFGGLKKIG